MFLSATTDLWHPPKQPQPETSLPIWCGPERGCYFPHFSVQISLTGPFFVSFSFPHNSVSSWKQQWNHGEVCLFSVFPTFDDKPLYPVKKGPVSPPLWHGITFLPLSPLLGSHDHLPSNFPIWPSLFLNLIHFIPEDGGRYHPSNIDICPQTARCQYRRSRWSPLWKAENFVTCEWQPSVS
jgi:hypothetical protein